MTSTKMPLGLKIYLITPVVLFVSFIAFYSAHEARQAEARAIREAKAREESVAREAEQKRQEELLNQEAKRQAEERARLDREKQDAEDTRRMAEIVSAEAKLAKATAQITELEKVIATDSTQLKAIQTERKALDEELFQLAIKVEKARMKKSATDLDGQRLMDSLITTVTRDYSERQAATAKRR